MTNRVLQRSQIDKPHRSLQHQLPPPPKGKVGWPWTADFPQLADTLPDGSPWPKISIVTPSFNQGQFIEETIRSILLQGYPNLEYIIIDGGSTDDSLDIIKKYEKWLTYWISEPDTGQSNALNKGLSRVTGTISAWLNSDDVYCPNAFFIIGSHYSEFEDIDIIYGDGELIDENSVFLESRQLKALLDFNDLKTYYPCPFFQPSVFFKRNVFRETGRLDENLHYAMDLDFWIRAFPRFKSQYISSTLSKFRIHSSGKTKYGLQHFLSEELLLISRYHGSPNLFNIQFYQFIGKRSIIDKIECEAAFEKTLSEIKILPIQSVYLESVKIHKTDIIANAYLWLGDYYYNNLDSKMCRSMLLKAKKIFPATLKNPSFRKIFGRSLLPKFLLRKLRRITRKKALNYQGVNWIDY